MITNPGGNSYGRDSLSGKKLKVEEYLNPEFPENKENSSNNKSLQAKGTSLISKGSHIPDLSLEEGAILIENWKKTNFGEFTGWLENACAQATFQIEEKLSMDNKSKKSKPVQIKSFQCHLHVKFMDSALESLIVQKKLIKYGLRDKSFLENKAANKSFVKDKVESKLLAPEEEKKNKELKGILESIQSSLSDDKFDEACVHFSKIKQLKNYEWFEVCGLWTYIVKKRNTRYVKIVLDLIAKNHSKSGDDLGPNSPSVAKAKNKLYSVYGHSRMRAHNPYELYDHRALAAELTFPPGPPNENNPHQNPVPSDLNLRPFDQETFKNIFGPSYGVTEPLPEDTVYDLDIVPYKAMLDKTGVREIKNPEFNYINMGLLIDMYDLLMFSGDIKFSSIAAEIIYASVRMDDMGFVNWCAAHYFSSRRNQVFHEMLEVNYNKFIEGSEFTKLEGTVDVVGRKFKQEVVMFSPREEEAASKVLRRGTFASSPTRGMFKEGEFVLLLSKKPQSKEGMFDELPEKDISRRYQTTLELIGRNPELLKRMGIVPGEAVCAMAFISEISANYRLKLLVLFDDTQIRLANNLEITWHIVRSNNNVPNFPRICESLKLFSTKITMNPSLQQLLLATPHSNTNCLNKLARSSSITMNSGLNESIKSALSGLEDKVNISQLEAIKSSMYQTLTLIQAPPGTNRYLAAVELIRAWGSGSSSQVLVFSKNKLGLDHIHMALLKNHISTICLSDECEMEESAFEDQTRALAWICQHNFTINPNCIKFDLLKSIVEQFKVVCCTTNELICESMKSFSFARVLVDDAQQISEPELIAGISKNSQQLVLLGDDKQLPPCGISPMAKSKGLSMSLYEKMVRQKIKPILFNIQYNMHPSIYNFPSARFYQGMITNGIKESQVLPVKGIEWPNKQMNILFIHTPSREEYQNGNLVNHREAEVIGRLLARVIQAKDVYADEICLIASYSAQKMRLRHEVNQLKQKYSHMVDGHTAAALQAGICLVEESGDIEKDLAIVSTTRANPKLAELDVLGDPRAMNVVLTRGRRGLVVVGDLQTLSVDENWREWLLWANSNGLVSTF